MTKEENTNNNLRLGIFIIIGTAFFILAMYSIGDKQNLFGSTIKVNAVFRHVSGLQKGNNVRFGGINIGTVKDVQIINDSSILVVMTLQDQASEFIRKDAIAAIGTDGLMGNQLVNISPGNSQTDLVANEDTLVTLGRFDSDRILRSLGQTNNNVEIISASLVEIIDKINKGEGTLGKLINDPGIATGIGHTVNDLNTLSMRVTELVILMEENIRHGKGTVGSLITDTVLATNIRETVDELNRASTNIEKTTSELSGLVTDLKAGQGVVGSLMTDSNLVGKMERSLSNIEEGTAAFNENMEALKHNFLFRGYFKDLEKEEKKKRKKE